MLEYPLLFVFPIAMAFAAAMDLFTMTIPNRISIILVAAFVGVAPVSGMSLMQFGMHVATGLAVLAAGILMFSRGWLGGGDAKLLAATSLWLGHELLLPYLVWASFLGGGLALLILAYRNVLPPRWAIREAWAMRLHDRQAGIPYGIALAGAALLIYPSTKWYALLLA